MPLSPPRVTLLSAAQLMPARLLALSLGYPCLAVCPPLLQRPSAELTFLSFASVSPPSQVRECATALLHVAKRERVPVFLVGDMSVGCASGPPPNRQRLCSCLAPAGGPHRQSR